MTDLVKVNNSELAAQMEDIKSKMGDVIAAAISPNTRRAYAVQWQNFTAFCERFGLAALPAAPSTVAAYITEFVSHKKSVSAMGQALASISAAHKRAGFDDVTKAETVKVSAKGARRLLGCAPHKKSAATVDVVRALVDGLDRTTIQGKRDAALLLVGFSGAFRRSELVALDVADLEKTTTPDGRAAYLVTIRHSKTDQEGRGMVKGLYSTQSRNVNPVAALDDYMQAAGITDGPVFRRVRRGDHIEPQRIVGRTVALIVKAAAQRANVSLDLSGHSLRSGFITSALAAGESERAIMNQSGHRSVTVMRGYQQRANALQDNAAAGLSRLM